MEYFGSNPPLKTLNSPNKSKEIDLSYKELTSVVIILFTN